MAFLGAVTRCARRVVVAGVLLPFPLISEAQTCPQNCLPNVGCSTANCSSFYIPSGHGYGSTSGSYCVSAGSLECSGGWGSASIATTDRFVVLQAPLSGPLTLEMEMHFTFGAFEGGGNGSVSIPGKGEVQYGCASGSNAYVNCDERKRFSFSVAMGDTFTVNATCFGGSGAFGSYGAHVVYALRSVPPGVVIRSCYGYVVNTVVPVRRASWASVKRYYR